jgi:YD repeat-containing protein
VENRLVTVTQGISVTTFVYDGDGARVRQVKPDGSQVVYVGGLFEQELPLFADGFESGNLSAWSSSVTDSGNLSVSAAGALVGNYGLQAVINNTNPKYVQDDTPTAENHYWARFYFDPNTVNIPSGSHFLFFGYNSVNVQLVRIEFAKNGGAYQVRASARLDGVSVNFATTNWYTISDAAHSIEFEWQASSAAGANNGYLALLLDGALQQILTGLDNDARLMDYVRLGVGGVPSGTSGTEYFDGFESRRTSCIYRSYYFAGGQRVGLRVMGDLTPANNGVFYLLGDHLGSTSVTANGTTGALVSEMRYKPWGETRYNSGSVPTSKHFTGQVDEGSALGGLYFYNARMYLPYLNPSFVVYTYYQRKHFEALGVDFSVLVSHP